MSNTKLRLHFKPATVRNYNLASAVQQTVMEQERVISKENHQFQATLEQKVLAVDDDQSAHVISTTVPVSTTATTAPPKSLVYEHLDSRGQLLASSGQGQSSAFSFPDEPVEVGSSWSGTTQGFVPSNPEPIKMTYQYRLESLEEYASRPCARISFQSDEIEFTVPTPDGKSHSRVRTSTGGTMFFSVEEGFLVHLDLTTRTQPELGKARVEIVNRLTQDYSEK